MAKQPWEQLEADCAKLIAGRGTPGSGSKRQKGDISSRLYLAECKWRSACPFPLDLTWLTTITTYAMQQLKTPILAIEDGEGYRALLLPREASSARDHVIRKTSVIELDLASPSTFGGYYFENLPLGIYSRSPWVLMGWPEAQVFFLPERKEKNSKQRSCGRSKPLSRKPVEKKQGSSFFGEL